MSKNEPSSGGNPEIENDAQVEEPEGGAFPTPGFGTSLPEEFFDDFFEGFGETFEGFDPSTDDGREAFMEFVEEEFDISPETGDSFAARPSESDLTWFREVGGGGSATRAGTNDVVTLFNCDLLDADQQARRFVFDQPGEFSHVDFVFIDSENVRHAVQRNAPEDAPVFTRTLLNNYDPFGEGGAGRSPYQMALWTFSDRDLLEKVVTLLNNDGFSIEVVRGGLGGGTGSGLILSASELARLGAVGTGPGMLGVSLTTQEFLLENDDVNTISGMPERKTICDEVDILRRLDEDVRNGDIDFVQYATNPGLALHGCMNYENWSYEEIRTLYDDLRENRSLVELGFDYRRDAEIQPYLNMGVINEAWTEIEFPFKLMGYRPVECQFRRGKEMWDVADAEGLISGHFWSRGFVGVDDFDALANRIPNFSSIESHDSALDGATRLAAHKLASDIAFEDIEKAVAFVFAPDWDLTRSDLHLVEDVLEEEYGAASLQTTKAIEIGGLDPENVPSSPRFGVWVAAGHQAPLASKEAMFKPEFLEVMPEEANPQ